MDVRQLSYFANVAQLGSFSKASHQLHVTQPTISKVIKGLEDELGVPLLHRTTKEVTVTDAGEVVLRHAVTVMSAMADLRQELDDIYGTRKGSIKVGLPPMTGSTFFPPVLAGFRRLHSDISITLVERGALRIERDVEEGNLDLGVALLPVDAAVFETHPFAEQYLKVVLPPNHRLAGKSEIELIELEHEPFILYQEEFTLHKRIRERCQEVGFEPKIAFESSQWDLLSEMAAAGLGIALLPEAICQGLSPKRVASIPLVNPSIPWNLALIWRKGRYLSFAGREFLRFAMDQMPKYMGVQ